MGKAGKILKFFGKKDKSGSPQKPNERRKRKGSKDGCLFSLGKSSSRRRETAPAAASPLDIVEIKTVQVQNSTIKETGPKQTAYLSESDYGGKAPDVGPVSCRGFQEAFCTGPLESIKELSQEDLAAVKIQAAVRCFLAKRHFRALKSLVRVQSLIRGRIVRNRAARSLRCMNALIRIQALARGRRVRTSELGQLVQKHLQQTRQQRKKPVEGGWINSIGTVQQLQAKAQSKQDAVMKRQRALVYAFTEQLNRSTGKHITQPNESKIDRSYWVWVWLDRWMVAFPQRSSSSGREQHEPIVREVEKVKTKSERLELSRKEVTVKRESDNVCERQTMEIVQEVHVRDAITVSKEKETEKISASESEEIKSTLPEFTSEKFHDDISSSMDNLSHSLVSHDRYFDAHGDNEQKVDASADSSMVSSNDKFTYPSMFEEVTSFYNHEGKPESVACGIKPSSCTSQTTDFSSKNPDAYTVMSQEVTSPPNEVPTSPTAGLVEFQAESPSKASISNLDTSSTFSLPELAIALQSGSPAFPSQVDPALSSVQYNCSSNTVPDIISDKKLSNDDATLEDDLISINVNGTLDDADNGVVKCEPQSVDTGASATDDVSESNVECDVSVTSVDQKNADISSRHVSSHNSKHELQKESVSPSVPSYMATTKSSKAKIRALTSPTQKSDSPKQKFDSPKLKFESPQQSPKPKANPLKQKTDSPNQKLELATKRRHSLSALEARNAQRHAVHVRSSINGPLSLQKDANAEHSPRVGL